VTNVPSLQPGQYLAAAAVTGLDIASFRTDPRLGSDETMLVNARTAAAARYWPGCRDGTLVTMPAKGARTMVWAS